MLLEFFNSNFPNIVVEQFLLNKATDNVNSKMISAQFYETFDSIQLHKYTIYQNLEKKVLDMIE